MRCLFSTFFSVIGIVLLLAGGFLLYTALANSPEVRTATLGGASQTQEQIAAETGGQPIAPDLPVVMDGQRSSTNVVGEPVLDQSTISNLAQVSPEERTAIAERGLEVDSQVLSNQAAEAAPDVTGIQSNVVLKNEVLTSDTNVAVVPLNIPQSGETAGVSTLDGVGGATAADGTTEQRVVEFEWPEQFRSGESGVIRLTLKALPGGIQVSSPEIPTNAIIATPILLTDCYTSYEAKVTATIIAPEFEIDRSATTEVQTLGRGQEATWRWTLKPESDGKHVITVALRMQWVLRAGATASPPVCASLAQSSFTFWGQSVQVEVNQVFGLITVPQASIAGTVLAVIGFVSQLPFAGEIFSVLFERNLERRAERRRERQQSRRRR